MDILLAVAILGLLALVAAHREPERSGSIDGYAVVLDGDTVVVADERLRLRGIDAPETDQTCFRDGADYPCGREARAELIRLIGGAPLLCDTFGRDAYRRRLAECRAGGRDLNRRMVERGWAVSYGAHRDAEDEARRARHGLWAGTFDRPQDWRRGHGGADNSAQDGIWEWLRSLLPG